VKRVGADTEGVVIAFGGLAAGITLYLEGGVPVFDYNYFDDHTTLKGSDAIDGDATIEVDFAYEGSDTPGGPATVTLSVDGEQVAQEKLDATVPGRFGIDTFGIGLDTGQPVTTDYEAPFAFTAEIEQVEIAIK
jgi:arylsulfatase